MSNLFPRLHHKNETARDMAEFILRADAMRRGAADDVPLPRDPTARMIAQFAQEIGQAPKARTTSGLSEAAKLILNADRVRRGADIDEAI
jgi:hypothetical protein